MLLKMGILSTSRAHTSIFSTERSKDKTMAKISNIYFITVIVTIGGLLQGFDISSLSEIPSTKPFKKHYGSPNSAKQGSIAATISGGSFMGYHFAFFLSDRIGRKPLLQIGCLIFIVGAIFCAASVDIAMLIVGRFICGFAFGEWLSSSEKFV
jgi:MFS family permease